MVKRIIFFLFVITVVSLSQNVSVKDYLVPVSQATNLRVNGFWNWAQVGDSVTGNTMSANLIYRRFYTSLPFAWFINVDGTGGRDAGNSNYDVRTELSARKYVWDNRDWFGFASFTGQKTNSYSRVASNVTVGAGFGRYINATALAKVVRIEEHLLKENIISDHLPKETMISIANIIEREDEYRDLYGEVFETQWFGDIENEIRLSGMLNGYSIGAIGILRIRQVLFNINERVNDRYYGWDISAGSLFAITTRDRSKAGSPNLSITGRYSNPLSWRTQINLSAEVFTPMDSSFIKKYTATANLDFIYELSNRVNFIAGYRIQVYKPHNDKETFYNSLNGSFLFYIENNIYLGINASLEKSTGTSTKMSTSLTLSYNFF